MRTFLRPLNILSQLLSLAISRRVIPLIIIAAAMGIVTGCSMQKLTGITMSEYSQERVVPYTLQTDDIGMACELGVSMGPFLMSFETVLDSPPHRSSVLTAQAAGMCSELQTWEAELEGLLAVKESRIGSAKDARIREKRHHYTSAKRFYRAYQEMMAIPVSEQGCPEAEDEIYYLLGLTSGLLAVIHDRITGGEAGVPMDIPMAVMRASECLDNETWWGVPSAIRASIWLTVPGAIPDGADAWKTMEEATTLGDNKGVRLAQAFQIQAAATSGNDQKLCEAISGYSKSIQKPAAEQWKLLDRYAYLMIRQELDRLWISEEGHRMPEGEMNCFWNSTSNSLSIIEEEEPETEILDDEDEDMFDELDGDDTPEETELPSEKNEENSE